MAFTGRVHAAIRKILHKIRTRRLFLTKFTSFGQDDCLGGLRRCAPSPWIPILSPPLPPTRRAMPLRLLFVDDHAADRDGCLTCSGSRKKTRLLPWNPSALYLQVFLWTMGASTSEEQYLSNTPPPDPLRWSLALRSGSQCPPATTSGENHALSNSCQ